ncbi:MAG TPA: MFS transporter [Thermoanaerobaculia bacterium]|nr:MFS transporter [Thermoanaerobaculia bacterium]
MRTGPPTRDRARVARWGLGVLTLINLFNYLDRYVGAALVESLRKSELHLSDKQLGWLPTAFIVVYMLASPFFGARGDRGSRPRLIAAGVAIWSVATGLGGLARNFISLFLARAAVGIGEAAYGTISPALLADYFPLEMRGRVFAVFSSAIPIGSAAGYVVGGLINQHWGWRAAFFVAGFPGLALAFLAARLVDPPRGAQDKERVEGGGGDPEDSLPDDPGAAGSAAAEAAPGPAKGAAGVLQGYRELLKNRPYALAVLGYAAYTFALGGVAYWMPAFLERVRHVPSAQATVQFGLIVVATGFAGTFAGGWLGDYFLRRSKQAYLWLCGWSALAAAPLTWVAFAASSRPLYMSALIGAQVFVFLSTGPINSAIINAVRPGARATAVALSIFAIHLFGDVPSPFAIGVISDATSLGQALLIVPVAIALGGLIWLYAAWTGDGRRKTR